MLSLLQTLLVEPTSGCANRYVSLVNIIIVVVFPSVLTQLSCDYHICSKCLPCSQLYILRYVTGITMSASRTPSVS